MRMDAMRVEMEVMFAKLQEVVDLLKYDTLLQGMQQSE